MGNRRCMNVILIVIGLICPFLFPLGCIGLFASEGSETDWWLRLLGYFTPIAFLFSGLIGSAAVLTVLIKNRKWFKNKLVWFGIVPLLLLLGVNLYFFILVLRFFFPCL